MPTQNLMAATSALPQVLVSQQLAATETTQYTGPANSSVKLAEAVLSNTTAAAVTVSVSLCKTGQTAGASNRVVPGYSLAAGDSLVVRQLEGQFLGPGDFISAIASAATSVAFAVSGVVFS